MRFDAVVIKIQCINWWFRCTHHAWRYIKKCSLSLPFCNLLKVWRGKVTACVDSDPPDFTWNDPLVWQSSACDCVLLPIWSRYVLEFPAAVVLASTGLPVNPTVSCKWICDGAQQKSSRHVSLQKFSNFRLTPCLVDSNQWSWVANQSERNKHCLHLLKIIFSLHNVAYT